jgi:hypothetical protein
MSQDICLLEQPREDGARRVTRRRLRSRRQIVAALTGSGAGDVFVLPAPENAAAVVSAMREASPGVRRARVVSYQRPGPLMAQIIESGFDRVLLGAGAMIPFEDLVEVLDTPHPGDYSVGAEWDAITDTIAVWRGDLSVLVFPISAFPARGGVAPDPARLSVEDCGQTLRMGEYEASVDALLFERDSEYRRRAKKRMIAEQRGLGPSVRRLRLSRGVGRDDFPGVDAKTIARIERGEVERPQAATLAVIAKRLGVAADTLDTY